MDKPVAALQLFNGDVVEIRRQNKTLAVCRRHARGWTAQVGTVEYQVTSLDAVLELIGRPIGGRQEPAS